MTIPILGSIGSALGRIARPLTEQRPDSNRPAFQMPGSFTTLPAYHSSILQRIGHDALTGLKGVGEGLGTVYAPQLMTVIPGTPQHQLFEQNLQQRQANIARTNAEAHREQALANLAASPPVPKTKELTPEQEAQKGAYDYEIQQGKTPTDAYQLIYGKPQKPEAHKYGEFTTPSVGGKPGTTFEGYMTDQGPMMVGATPTLEAGALPVAKTATAQHYNILDALRAEHPDWTPEQLSAAMQHGSMFPRVEPVTDAQGNLHGYNVIQGGLGGHLQMSYLSAGEAGAPTAPGGVIPPKPTTAILSQSQRANMIEPEVKKLDSAIDDTSQSLGPLAGRWEDVLTGKVGVNNPEVAQLQIKLKLFTTALMLAHGLRGEEYDKILGQYFQLSTSPANLKARIAGANDFLEDYINSTGHGGGNAPSSSESVIGSADDVAAWKASQGIK